MSCFGIRKTALIPFGGMQIWYSSIYTLLQKKQNSPRCISFETECKYHDMCNTVHIRSYNIIAVKWNRDAEKKHGKRKKNILVLKLPTSL